MFIFKIPRQKENELKNNGRAPKVQRESFVFVNVLTRKSCG